MGKRLDVVMSTKDKQGKSRYTKVGCVFIGDDGRMSLVVDQGVSISTPPGTFCNLMEPRPRQESGAPQTGKQQENFDADDMPF